jgi:hypothetical protein
VPARKIFVFSKFEECGVVYGDNGWLTRELECQFFKQWATMLDSSKEIYFQKELELRDIWESYDRQKKVYQGARQSRNASKRWPSKTHSDGSDGYDEFIWKFIKSNDGSNFKLKFPKKR